MEPTLIPVTTDHSTSLAGRFVTKPFNKPASYEPLHINRTDQSCSNSAVNQLNLSFAKNEQPVQFKFLHVPVSTSRDGCCVTFRGEIWALLGRDGWPFGHVAFHPRVINTACAHVMFVELARAERVYRVHVHIAATCFGGMRISTVGHGPAVAVAVLGAGDFIVAGRVGTGA